MNNITINDYQWLDLSVIKNNIYVTLVEYDVELEGYQEDDTSDVWPYNYRELFVFKDSANLQEVLNKHEVTLREFKNLLMAFYAIDLDKYL